MQDNRIKESQRWKKASETKLLAGKIKAEVEIKTVTNMYTWMYASMNECIVQLL